jgi:hypothetical protein
LRNLAIDALIELIQDIKQAKVGGGDAAATD